MRKIHINAFNSMKDNRVKPITTLWSNFVELLTSGPSVIEKKTDVRLFNAARYKGIDEIPEYTDDWFVDPYTDKTYAKRRQINIIELDLLVLDYDGGLAFADAKARFKEYEFVSYSSFSHLHDGETEKFRIIIPLETPVPAGKCSGEFNAAGVLSDWYQITDALKNFAGPCDPKSFDPNQIYAMPSSHPSRVDNSFSYHNKGKWLDWRLFERTRTEPYPYDHQGLARISQVSVGDKTLSPDQILRTRQGNIAVRDVVGKIDNVYCPFHHDENPSAFVRKVDKSGIVFLYCSSTQCSRKYFMRQEETESDTSTDAETPENQESSLTQKEKRIRLLNEITDLRLPTPDYHNADDRTRVLKQLKKIQDKITRDDRHYFSSGGFTRKSHILYMPEGSGKSHLVVTLAQRGEKIIFACKSWEQVEKKYEEYLSRGIQEGFGVRIVRSKEAKARRRFGTKLVRRKPTKPFGTGVILDEESIELFIKNNPDLSPDFIRLSWKFFSSDRLAFEYIPHPDFDENGNLINEDPVAPLIDGKTKIVLTTFEQLRIHRLLGESIPNDWIIWFDDPDITDVIDIEPYDEDRWGELPSERLKTETREINGKRYYTRKYHQSLGYSLRNHKCVYTTTEVITRRAIELMLRKRGEEFVVHDNMDKIASGDITILGTKMVRKRYDGMIPLVARRLNKLSYKSILIADGLSTNLNHSNNKGRNDLDKINVLVELSIPHPVQVRTICDTLNLPQAEYRKQITWEIMLDRMHQAIGRNSGYRWKGNWCVVLVDPLAHGKMIDQTRYFIDTDNSVLIDRTGSMSRTERRTADAACPLVKEIETLLNNIDAYVADDRKIKPDIKHVFESIKTDSDRVKYAIRLLTALSNLSGVKFTGILSGHAPDDPRQRKYMEIGEWILLTWVPEGKRSVVIREVVGDEEITEEKFGT